MDWWLIVQTPSGLHLWNLGRPADEQRDDLILRARTHIGFPAGDALLPGAGNWDLALSPGEPHGTLLHRATVHDLADLARVPDADVQAYRCDCEQAARTASLDAARAAIAQLDSAQRDALRAELDAEQGGTLKSEPGTTAMSSTSTARSPGGRP